MVDYSSLSATDGHGDVASINEILRNKINSVIAVIESGEIYGLLAQKL